MRLQFRVLPLRIRVFRGLVGRTCELAVELETLEGLICFGIQDRVCAVLWRSIGGVLVQARTAALLRSGAPISAINCVRKALSRVKGWAIWSLLDPL